MKRLLGGMLAASMLLSACNVQSVDEYEKEKARLESEQAATASSTVNETSSAQLEPVEAANKQKSSEDAQERKDKAEIKPDDKEAIDKQVDKEKIIKDTDKVATPAAPAKTEEQQTNDAKPAAEEKTATPKEATAQDEKSTTSAADTTNKQPTSADKTTSEHQKPATTAPVKQPTPDNTAKPKPTTPQKEDKKETVTVSVRVDTLLQQEHFNRLPEALQSTKYVPSNGIILKAGTYTIEKGDSAWTATRKALQKHGIHFEYEGEGESGYGSVYVEGINHIYEKQAGSLSGWMFAVNGKAPGVGASAYDIKDGDKITWHYTTNLGRDIGLADQ